MALYHRQQLLPIYEPHLKVFWPFTIALALRKVKSVAAVVGWIVDGIAAFDTSDIPRCRQRPRAICRENWRFALFRSGLRPFVLLKRGGFARLPFERFGPKFNWILNQTFYDFAHLPFERF